MAGVCGERPRAMISRAIALKVVNPMKMTSVSAAPTLSQSISETACPVTNVTTEV